MLIIHPTNMIKIWESYVEGTIKMRLTDETLKHILEMCCTFTTIYMIYHLILHRSCSCTCDINIFTDNRMHGS
jgi:hypothetical protein